MNNYLPKREFVTVYTRLSDDIRKCPFWTGLKKLRISRFPIHTLPFSRKSKKCYHVKVGVFFEFAGYLLQSKSTLAKMADTRGITERYQELSKNFPVCTKGGINLNFSKIGEGSKFAVECDWNSKISQNVQNLGFFKKNTWVIRKKNLEILKNR